jgi:RHS repeat-associated protein
VYRFSSKEWIYDGSSGYYSYGFRFYDPNLQRWVNRDPLGGVAGVRNIYRQTGFHQASGLVDRRLILPFDKWTGPNPYKFADNDSINEFDPLGLWTFGIGFTITIQFGPINLNISSGFVMDNQGNVGTYLTSGGGGGAGAHAAGGVSFTASDAPTICDLRKWFGNLSGGAGYMADASAEGFVGSGSGGPVLGGGITLGAGLGAGGSAGGSYTWIDPIGKLW